MKKYTVFAIFIWFGLLVPQIGFGSEGETDSTQTSSEESSSGSWWDNADKVGGGLILGALLLGAWHYLSQKKSSPAINILDAAEINISDAAQNFYNARQSNQPIDDITLKFSLDTIENNINELLKLNEPEYIRMVASIRAYVQNLSNNAKSEQKMESKDYAQKIFDKLETTTPGQLQPLSTYFGSDSKFQILQNKLQEIIHEEEYLKRAKEEIENARKDLEKFGD